MWLAFAAIGQMGCDDDDVHGVRDREPPPVPAGVYSVTGDESVEIRWSPIVGTDVAGYEVYTSFEADRGFDLVARVSGEATDSYVHRGLENGVTRYYAVAAYDYHGNASDLSIELVHDTPRPDGRGLRLFTRAADFANAAVDWSEYEGGSAAMGVPYDASLADFVIEAYTIEGRPRLYLVPTRIADGGEIYMGDAQDFGYTNGLDDIDWAPCVDCGWSENPEGVELILGHSYIVWTWDDYYAKFRVTDLTPSSATLDWAYQATDDYDFRFELAPGWKGGAR
jgi:hypothetical protein